MAKKKKRRKRQHPSQAGADRKVTAPDKPTPETRQLLVESLRSRFRSGHDVAAIYDDAEPLRNTDAWDEIASMVAYCKYARIEQLWREERYEAIKPLLLPYPHEFSASSLHLHAQTAFKLATTSAAYLPDLMLFWLSAVYDEELSRAFAETNEDQDRVRGDLIRMAEDLIRGYRADGDETATAALKSWLIEKKLIAERYTFCADKPELRHLVVTPRFAGHIGLSEAVLGLIRDNRNGYASEDMFLAAGACYSAGGRSMLLLEEGRYDEALAALPKSPPDAWSEYALQRVRFACGLHMLGTGEGRPERYLKRAADLFEKSPQLEDDLVKKVQDVHEEAGLQSCLEILTRVHARRPSKAIKQALSLVITRRAIVLYNSRKISNAVLATSMRKALDMDPENELALRSLRDTVASVEIDEMTRAIDKHKMNRACRLAAESDHPEVRDRFFRYMEQMLESVQGESIRHRAIIDISEWCAAVDETHPFTEKVCGMREGF